MSSSQSSNFQSILSSAVRDYYNWTGQDLAAYSVASGIHSSNTPDSVLALLQEQVQKSEGNAHTGHKLISSLRPMIASLCKISSVDVGPTAISTPEKLIFSAIAIVIQTAVQHKKTDSDFLIDLVESIEHFMGRLQIYNLVQRTPALSDILAKILAEILHVLATATIQLKRGKITKFSNFKDSSKEGLKRLDRLTLEETRITVTQTLEAVYALTTSGLVVQESIDDIRQLLGVMQETHIKIDKIERDQFQQNCRRWLSAPDPWANHIAARERCLVGTAEWFIHGATFAHWKESGSLLWIYGIPGSGKSVFCSTIIQDVLVMCRDEFAALAFFYFDHQDATKLDARCLLTSLLVQLCDQSGCFYEAFSILYQEYGHGARQPEENALIECLKNMISRPGQPSIYVILDALDECPNSHGSPSTRQRVLEVLRELIGLGLPNLHFCVTSRPEIDIRWVLEPLTLTDSHVILQDEPGQRLDIAKYVRWVVHTDPAIQRWPAEEKRFIIDVLTQSSDGMFQWASGQLETLRHFPLQSIPHVLEYVPATLSEMYERALQGINKEKWEFAHRIFQSLTVSARPLRVEELAEVFAIEINPDLMTEIPKYNARWRPENAEDAVLSTCSGLITLHKERTVQFSHYSVREFLTSDRISNSATISNFHVSLERAHTFLARACVSILLKLNRPIDKSSIEDFPLASYAASHWVDHAQFGNVSMTIRDGLERLFTRHEPSSGSWIQILDKNLTRESPSPAPTESEQPDADPLYYAALFGFCDMAKHLLRTRQPHVDPVGGYYMTPLRAALARGHVTVAGLLLASGADVNVRDGQGRMPLHIAAEHGDPKPIQSLIDSGSDPNAEDGDGETPLSLVSGKGKLDAAKLLLRYGADVKHKDSTARTPLHRACHEGHHEIVLLLLNHRADSGARDYRDSTPLHQASRKGELAVVRTLLDHHANVNALDKSGWTPLHCATEQGYEEVVRLLLERGADANHKASTGWFPLHRASSGGYLEIVLLLLKYGARPGAREHHNVQERSDSQAQDHDAQGHHDNDEYDHPNTQEDDSSASSYLAAHEGELAVDHDAQGRHDDDEYDQANTQEDDGSTSSYLVAHEGELAVVRPLFEHDNVQEHSDSQAQDHDAQGHHDDDEHDHPNTQEDGVPTSSHLAAHKGEPAVVWPLLEHDNVQEHSDSQAQDHDAQGHHDDDEYDQANTQEDDGSTSHLAAHKGEPAVVWPLLEHDNLQEHSDSQAQDHDAQGHHDDDEHDHPNTQEHGLAPLHPAAHNEELAVDHDVQGDHDEQDHPNTQEDDGSTPLHLAAHKGELAIVRALLAHGAEVDTLDKSNRTPLHRACDGGRHKIVPPLLDHGADLNARNCQDLTPLNQASRKGELAVVRTLLDHHADVNTLDKSDWTPLYCAIEQGHEEVVQLLLERRAAVGHQESSGWTPLHRACAKGHEKIVELLIKHGAEVDARDKMAWTPLLIASKNGHRKVISLLLDSNADLLARNHDNHIFLDVASAEGHVGIADVNARYKDQTVLYISSQRGDLEVIQRLLDLEADTNLANEGKETPLFPTSRNGNLNATCLLLKYGANVDHGDSQERTPLHFASENGHIEVTQLLLESGANVDHWDSQERTPLHCASEKGHAEVTKLLLESGANVNHRDSQQRTPLHRASENGHNEVTKVLLKRGAKVDARQVEGWTPLHLASQRGKDGVATILLDHDANCVDAQNDVKRTSLHVASQEGHLEVVELLLTRKANVDVKDEDGETALHLAAYYGHIGVVKVLLNRAKPDIQNRGYKTPLDLAEKKGHEAVSMLLKQHLGSPAGTS